MSRQFWATQTWVEASPSAALGATGLAFPVVTAGRLRVLYNVCRRARAPTWTRDASKHSLRKLEQRCCILQLVRLAAKEESEQTRRLAMSDNDKKAVSGEDFPRFLIASRARNSSTSTRNTCNDQTDRLHVSICRDHSRALKREEQEDRAVKLSR